MTRLEPRRRTAWKHFTEIQTRWEDNDQYGHVNNTVYYSWFDTTVNLWLIRGGLLDVKHGSAVNLVAETGCTYFESVAYPETVDIGLKVAKLGTSSVTYELGVFRKGNELTAALGRFVHVAVDRATQRPVPMSVDMRSALSELIAA